MRICGTETGRTFLSVLGSGEVGDHVGDPQPEAGLLACLLI